MGVDLFGSHKSYEMVHSPMPYLHMPKVYLFAWRWFKYLCLELLYFICSQFTPLLLASLYYFTMQVDTIWRRAVKHLKNRVVYLHHWQRFTSILGWTLFCIYLSMKNGCRESFVNTTSGINLSTVVLLQVTAASSLSSQVSLSHHET